jgi:hypothetical protein
VDDHLDHGKRDANGSLPASAAVHSSMRFIRLAAAVSMGIAVLVMGPVVLMGASAAHADTHGYLRCIKSDAEPPPDARELPGVSLIEQDLNSGDSAAQVVQILVGMGVKPSDAVREVQCVQVNWPIGAS